MNFFKMSSWANYPEVDPNHHIIVTSSQELSIPKNKIVEIKLGLLLLSLPKNHIVKITNPQQNYKIISEFWLPSPNELKLVVIAKTPCYVKEGEKICQLQILPVQLFLPGKFKSTFKKSIPLLTYRDNEN